MGKSQRNVSRLSYMEFLASLIVVDIGAIPHDDYISISVALGP